MAPLRSMRFLPKEAPREKKAIGAQHRKSVKTSSAIRLATRVSLEFQAWEWRMLRYMHR